VSGPSGRRAGSSEESITTSPPAIRAVLFDLDGTLVDSKRDLATGINRMREELGLDPLPIPRIIAHVGWGARNLVAKCTLPGRSDPGTPSTEAPTKPPAEPPADVDGALEIFRKHYDDCLLDTTTPYSGIPEMLREASMRGLSLGLVSNKPERFCRKILAGLGLADPFFMVVGGDTAAERKPHPAPLQMVLRVAGLPPTAAVMVGDSRVDVEAARATGCPSIFVTWGLHPEGLADGPNPDHVVGSVPELARCLWANAT
jgi:2-phosphoglycolate phosphatase